MNSETHMNYLALNQDILNKPIVIGKGFREGESKTPISTFNGLQVYLSGINLLN